MGPQHSTAGRACSGSLLAIDIDDVNCVARPSPCFDFVFACLSRLSAYLSYATCAALQLDKRERTSAGSYVFIRLASFLGLAFAAAATSAYMAIIKRQLCIL